MSMSWSRIHGIVLVGAMLIGKMKGRKKVLELISSRTPPSAPSTRTCTSVVPGCCAALLSASAATYTIDADGAGPSAPFTIADPDFTSRSLRGTAVVRWEYRPASALFVVWQQDRGREELGRDCGHCGRCEGEPAVPLERLETGCGR